VPDAPDDPIAPEDPIADPEPPELPAAADTIEQEELSAALSEPSGPVPLELRDVTFSTSMRGYDRGEVDAYVELVNRTIAELEVNRSPESAVKQALDRVGEQTARVLQQAREAAEDLTAAARAESEHAGRRARVEAAELVDQAQTRSQELLDRASEESEQLLELSKERLAELQVEIEEARQEREHVFEQLRSIAASLEAFAGGAADGAVPARLAERASQERGPEQRPDQAEQPTQVIRAGRQKRDGAKRSARGGSAEDQRQRVLDSGHPQHAPRRDASKAWRAARG
jgi:cell division initiation protein